MQENNRTQTYFTKQLVFFNSQTVIHFQP